MFRSTEKVPEPNFPIPPIPSPNAYDIYKQAAQMRQGSGGKLLGNDWQKYTLAQKEQLLASDQQTLLTLRSGFAHPYQPPIQRTPGSAVLSYSAEFRELARTLVAQGELYREEQEWDKAAQCYLDTIQFGMHLPHGDGIMGFLLGTTIEGMGRRYLWEITERLTPTMARETALHLQDLERKRYPLIQTFQEMEYTDGTYMANLLNKNGAWGIAAQVTGVNETAADLAQTVTALVGNGTSAPDKPLEAQWERLRYRVGATISVIATSKPTIYRQFRENNARLQEQIRQPYTPNPTDIPCPKDAVNAMFCMENIVLQQTPLRFYEAQAQNGLLAVALALRAYSQEKGDYPPTLQELVDKGYLRSVPNDPFIAGKPLSYQRLSEKQYLLYSVGPDGKDDSGKTGSYTQGKQGSRSQMDSTFVGDFVVGENTRLPDSLRY
jgi:hypothetical protein